MNLRRSSGGVGEVKELLDVLTASSGEKMMLPGVPVAILVEDFKVRDLVLDAFAKSINIR